MVHKIFFLRIKTLLIYFQVALQQRRERSSAFKVPRKTLSSVLDLQDFLRDNCFSFGRLAWYYLNAFQKSL